MLMVDRRIDAFALVSKISKESINENVARLDDDNEKWKAAGERLKSLFLINLLGSGSNSRQED